MAPTPPDTMQSFELLMDVRERLVRIETKVDGHGEAQKALRGEMDAQDARISAQGERVSSLETKNRILVSCGSLLLFLVTFFQDWITSRFT